MGERKRVQTILNISYTKKFAAVLEDRGEKEAVIVREAMKEYLDKNYNPSRSNNRF